MWHSISYFVKSILDISKLYKKNPTSTILGVICVIMISYYNLEFIKENLGLGVGVTEKYLEKTYRIERELDQIREKTKCDDINIALLHNGEVTLSRTHLLKWSLLYQSSSVANNWKNIFFRVSASPFVKLFSNMYRDGYVYHPNTKLSNDILIRNIYTTYKIQSVVYIPLFKNGKMIGFATLAYKRDTKLTEDNIHDYIRLMHVVQALL